MPVNSATGIAQAPSVHISLDKGAGIDFQKQLAAIENEILATNQKIQNLETKGLESLSDDEFDELFTLQDSLVALEKSQSEVNTAIIKEEKLETEKSDAELGRKLEEINGLISPSIRDKYPDLGRILQQGDNLIAGFDSDTSLTERAKIQPLLDEALAYLKNNEAVLAHISRDLQNASPAQYAAFKSFLVQQDASFEPIFQNIENRDAHIDIALEGGSIRKAEGNIIYGENGEQIDTSGSPPALSLEGTDGLVLPVTEIDAVHTEQSERKLAGLQRQIAERSQQISINETRLGRNAEMLHDLAAYDPNDFEAPEARNAFTEQIITANPELAGLEPDIMFVETGAEYLSLLTTYITKTQANTEIATEVLRAETAVLKREAGRLNAKIESQKRQGQEKIRVQKERVRASARFIGQAGASALVQKLQDLFTRINEANPVMLENGDIITGFSPATMTFMGSFSPSL